MTDALHLVPVTLAEGVNPLAFKLLSYGTAIVVTLGLFTLLATLVWPKIIAGLDERYAKIKSEIDAAEKARHEAESAQKKFEDKLRQAQEEATRTIAAAQATARKVADDLRAKNDAELTEMKTRALADILQRHQFGVRSAADDNEPTRRHGGWCLRLKVQCSRPFRCAVLGVQCPQSAIAAVDVHRLAVLGEHRGG